MYFTASAASRSRPQSPAVAPGIGVDFEAGQFASQIENAEQREGVKRTGSRCASAGLRRPRHTGLPFFLVSGNR